MKIDISTKQTELEVYYNSLLDASKPTEEEMKILGWVAEGCYMYIRACFAMSVNLTPYKNLIVYYVFYHPPIPIV